VYVCGSTTVVELLMSLYADTLLDDFLAKFAPSSLGLDTDEIKTVVNGSASLYEYILTVLPLLMSSSSSLDFK
jgi:hypothetical protein